MFNACTKYRAIFDLIDEMVFILDDQCNILNYNQAATNVLGMEPDDLIDKSIKDLIGKEHWYDLYELLNQDKNTDIHDIKFIKNDETPLNTKVQIYKINSPEGAYTILIVKDITKEKNYEIELLRFSNAIKFAANPIQITDVNGKMVFVNPAFEKVSGYKKEELVGKNPRILNSRKHSKEFWGMVWNEIITGKVWMGQIQNKRKDGSPFIAESIISPISDENGKIVGFLGVHHDITQKKSLEEHLVSAQRLGSIGTLAAGIAHEVGNPLTSISALTQVIQRSTNDIFIKSKLELIKNQINRIADIIRQLVDFSRPVQHIDKASNINEALKNAVNIVRFGQEVENIEFIFDLANDLPEVKIANEQIMQVFVNILMNAVDAILIKPGVIKVKSFKDRDNLHIIIEDNGKGISSKLIGQIFEPFFTTKKIGTGLGLGLWVSYGIIKNYNGDITVKSELSIGTKFQIILPKNLI